MLDKPAAQSATRTSGPLAGFRIVEFAGIGPGPFACMMLADMGAEVVTLDRIGAKKNLKAVATRGRKVVELDLKDKASIAKVLDLLAGADAIERHDFRAHVGQHHAGEWSRADTGEFDNAEAGERAGGADSGLGGWFVEHVFSLPRGTS